MSFHLDARRPRTDPTDKSLRERPGYQSIRFGPSDVDVVSEGEDDSNHHPTPPAASSPRAVRIVDEPQHMHDDDDDDDDADSSQVEQVEIATITPQTVPTVLSDGAASDSNPPGPDDIEPLAECTEVATPSATPSGTHRVEHVDMLPAVEPEPTPTPPQQPAPEPAPAPAAPAAAASEPLDLAPTGSDVCFVRRNSEPSHASRQGSSAFANAEPPPADAQPPPPGPRPSSPRPRRPQSPTVRNRTLAASDTAVRSFPLDPVRAFRRTDSGRSVPVRGAAHAAGSPHRGRSNSITRTASRGSRGTAGGVYEVGTPTTRRSASSDAFRRRRESYELLTLNADTLDAPVECAGGPTTTRGATTPTMRRAQMHFTVADDDYLPFSLAKEGPFRRNMARGVGRRTHSADVYRQQHAHAPPTPRRIVVVRDERIGVVFGSKHASPLRTSHLNDETTDPVALRARQEREKRAQVHGGGAFDERRRTPLIVGGRQPSPARRSRQGWAPPKPHAASWSAPSKSPTDLLKPYKYMPEREVPMVVRDRSNVYLGQVRGPDRLDGTSAPRFRAGALSPDGPRGCLRRELPQ